MKKNSGMRTAALAILLGMAAGASSPCRGTEGEQPPTIIDMRPNYEKPKDPVVNGALDKFLDDLSKAQDDIRMLYKQDKVKRYLGVNDMWTSYTLFTSSTTNTDYSLVFASSTGPITSFQRMVFLGEGYGHELRNLRYRIGYYDDGRVKEFARGIHDLIHFSPQGALEDFGAEVDDHTSARASWNANGKLKADGTSYHLARNEKNLPEFEEMLRHGDDAKRGQAHQAMFEIGSPSVPFVVRVLKDGDDSAREDAASILGALREKASAAVPDMTRRLQDDPSAAVRRQIVLALGMIGPAAKTAIPALEEASTNDAPELATAAKMALERIHRSSSK
jgi:hypothetical protein